MTTQPLDTRLRRLRLGYMAQAFEAHNAESIKAKHSFLEFLEALVDGELSARENKGLMKAQGRALPRGQDPRGTSTSTSSRASTSSS